MTAEITATIGRPYPKTVILSCIDSRVPVERDFDQGIGDLFVTRVAENVENDDNKLIYFHGGRYKQLSQFGGQVIREIIA